MDKIVIGSKTSISKEVVPVLKELLSRQGFALLSLPDDNDLEKDMVVISAIIGSSLYSGFSDYILVGEKDDKLPAHVEGIYNSSGITESFALGCLCPSTVGGETRIFDGRLAAKLLIGNRSNIAQVVIRYSSLSNKDQTASYPIVVNGEPGFVLRYRSKVVTNEIIDNMGFSEDEVYQLVDNILEECVVLKHNWSRGDLLFVNNQFTLHDRLPYSGMRRMLRVRFDDPLYQRISY